MLTNFTGFLLLISLPWLGDYVPATTTTAATTTTTKTVLQIVCSLRVSILHYSQISLNTKAIHGTG